MTKPVMNLTIHIDDDGAVTLSAADAAAEGHLWSIQRRPITIPQLRNVAKILGPDAVDGVERRLLMVRDRLASQASQAAAAAVRAQKAQERLASFEQVLGP